jgi:tetratricopeptide (TPR) repeat protein
MGGAESSLPPDGVGGAAPAAPPPAAVRPSHRLTLLYVAAIVAAYAVSLGGGFLNYDDDWLIRDNPILRRADAGALRAIWTDLGPTTRQQLGAEYLPVRDTLVWLEVRLFGFTPQALRAVSLLLYVTAALLLRAYLRRALADPVLAETAAWLFALHPVHAESVAWLAGQKDLVALLLVAAALHAYAGERRRWQWAVPPLLLAAMFGKAVAVAAPLLLPLHDFLVRRRPRWAVVAAAVAASVAALAVHVSVGRTVGMMAAWPGGSRLGAIATMGPVWWRYLAQSFVPVRLGLHHEVPARAASELLPWLCYLSLIALAVLAARAARRGDRFWVWAGGWFVLPLLPTSQVLAPLQNLMADRYLLLAVLGPCAVVAALARRLARPALTAGLVLVAGALTFTRAQAFTDSVSLWEDVTLRSPRWSGGFYQLGLAQREARRLPEAEAALRRAIELAPAGDTARRAGNNLAALLAAERRLAEAQAVLRETVRRFPGDPRALNNLAEITARLGQDGEARRLFEVLRARFPDYAPGQRNYQQRYGAPAPPGATSPARDDTRPPPAPAPGR